MAVQQREAGGGRDLMFRVSVPELLPWADPYIADLHRRHASELRGERLAAMHERLSGGVRRGPAQRRSHDVSRPLGRTIPSHKSGARAW